MKNSIITTTFAALLATTTVANADDSKHFNGGFVGAEVGYMDADLGANGLYFGGNAGYRIQKDSGLVFGIEGTFGKANVDVANINNLIDYQWGVFGTAGWAFGENKRNLVSVGAGYAKIKASVGGISASNGEFTSFLGYERALGNNFSFRARAATYEFDSVIGTVGFGYRF